MTPPADRIQFVPAELPYWFVPPMLADFECEHGRIGDCDECGIEPQSIAADVIEAHYANRVH